MDAKDDVEAFVDNTKHNIELKFGDKVVQAELLKEDLKDKIIDLKDTVEAGVDNINHDIASNLHESFMNSRDDKIDINDIERERVVIKSFKKK